MNTNNPSVAELAQLYNSNTVARALLDSFASRSYVSRETKLDRAIQLVERQGVRCSRGDVIKVFRSLEQAGCGRYVEGRRGHPSRFSWSVSLISVGQVAAGKAGDLVAIEEVSPSPGVEDEPDAMLEHVFKLRPGLPVTVALPSDLTGTEAERLATFIRSLPFQG